VPLLVLCLARPELERSLGETIRLDPLDDEDARLVVRSAAELDEQTQARIVGLAEGNALYIEQLAAFAAEGGEGLPPTLEAVLAGRLGLLANDERVVLQRAAVVGQGVHARRSRHSGRSSDRCSARVTRPAGPHPSGGGR